jgi:hypothetical protein
MAMYGMLITAMLFYKKLAADLKECDPCVNKQMAGGHLVTALWHIHG